MKWTTLDTRDNDELINQCAIRTDLFERQTYYCSRTYLLHAYIAHKNQKLMIILNQHHISLVNVIVGIV